MEEHYEKASFDIFWPWEKTPRKTNPESTPKQVATSYPYLEKLLEKEAEEDKILEEIQRRIKNLEGKVNEAPETNRLPRTRAIIKADRKKIYQITNSYMEAEGNAKKNHPWTKIIQLIHTKLPHLSKIPDNKIAYTFNKERKLEERKNNKEKIRTVTEEEDRHKILQIAQKYTQSKSGRINSDNWEKVYEEVEREIPYIKLKKPTIRNIYHNERKLNK